MLPNVIYVYDGAWNAELRLDEVVGYLREKTGTRVTKRDDPLGPFAGSTGERLRGMALERCAMRIRAITNQNWDMTPLPGEIAYEKKTILDPGKRIPGILYDGFRLREFYYNLILEQERTSEFLHLIVTNEMFGTWDRNDRRYHARTSIYSFPSIISVPGLVDAPAKPREYYLKRQLGLHAEILREEYSGYLHKDDDRLTEVLKGYSMQALFFHLTGEPFCDDRNCRLFNAHRQEELIQAQLKEGKEFCEKHEAMIGDFRSQISARRLKIEDS